MSRKGNTHQVGHLFNGDLATLSRLVSRYGGWSRLGALYRKAKPARRGRPRGTGTIDDSAALDKMADLLAGGSHTVASAAKQIAQSIKGHSETATSDRLRKKFAKASVRLNEQARERWDKRNHTRAGITLNDSMNRDAVRFLSKLFGNGNLGLNSPLGRVYDAMANGGRHFYPFADSHVPNSHFEQIDYLKPSESLVDKKLDCLFLDQGHRRMPELQELIRLMAKEI